MAKFNLEIPSGFKTQLRKGVSKNSTEQIFARIAFNSPNILQKVGSFLINTFESTEVAQSLRGNGSEDLAAHFGLSDGEANLLVDGMASIILNSIRIFTKPVGNRGIIRVSAINAGYSEFLSLPNAEYISQPSNISIPIMRWLLLDPDIDIGQAAYDIVFLGENSSFDDRIEQVSRSGRAIMVELETLGGGPSYVLPAIVRGSAGSNFLEFVIRQPNVAKQVSQIIINNI